jgi:hypothetical protein
MSKFRRLKRSANIAPGSAICCDCGMDTMPVRKPKPGTFEQFIVNDDVWVAAGMTPGKIDPLNHELVGGGFLCVGCIETRLGRRLQIEDFNPITIPLLIGEPWPTERLRSRALYRTQADEDAVKLAPQPEWQTEFTERGLAWIVELELPETETSAR